MKILRKLLLITLCMTMVFTACVSTTSAASLELLDVFATRELIEFELNAAVKTDALAVTITPEGEDPITADVTLAFSDKRIKATLPEGEKMDLDKSYTISATGITDANKDVIINYSATLKFAKLFEDDFEDYADDQEFYDAYVYEVATGARKDAGVMGEDGRYAAVLEDDETGNTRVRFNSRVLDAGGNDFLLVPRDVIANKEDYTSYVLETDVARFCPGELKLAVGQEHMYFNKSMTLSANVANNVQYFINGAATWEVSLVLKDDNTTRFTQIVERTDTSKDIYRLYYNGVNKLSIPHQLDKTMKYYGSTYGYFGFVGGSYPYSQLAVEKGWYSASKYCYIDNILAYKVELSDESTVSKNAEISNVNLTGIPADGSWGEGVELTYSFDCEATDILKTEYKWYGSFDYSAKFPDEWTLLATKDADNKYQLTASDEDKYIACAVELYFPMGEKRNVFNKLASDPVFKLSAPRAITPGYTYDEEKKTLKFDYTYVDYNSDVEKGTTFVWEESTDKQETWTPLSETTDTLQLDENAIEKHLRCTVTVKNDAVLGDTAEAVSLVYALPFRPVATVSISGDGEVGSRLSGSYEYFDENGDEEEGSYRYWYRVDPDSDVETGEKVGEGLSYMPTEDDVDYDIVFAVTPRNKNSLDGDEAFSDRINIEETKKRPSSNSNSSSRPVITRPTYKPTENVVTPENKPEATNTFSDMAGHWAEEEIAFLKAKDLVKGIDGEYLPEKKLTRAELITMVLRAFGLGNATATQESFTDVKKGDWYYNDIETAFAKGFMSGYEGKFGPNDEITREEIAKTVVTVYENMVANVEPSALDNYIDKDTMSSWSVDYIGKALKLGLMNGYEDNTFMPSKSATRAEAGMLIYRLYNLLSQSAK